MAGATFRIDDGVTARLAALAALAGDLRPTLERVGNDLLRAAELSFAESRSPFGEAWAPLAPSTLRRRRGGGAQPLIGRGRLRSSLHSTPVAPDTVQVGTNVAYGRLHNQGGRAGRGQRTTIPRRQFLPVDGLPPAGAQRVTDAVADAVRAALGGRP
jgi:phage virion morphogenesis protein